MDAVETAQTDVEKVVRDRLAASPAMYLATADGGTPWVGGVFFAENGLFTLELVVESTGRTLRAIRGNPTVAVVVSTGSPFEPFLQGQADAAIIEDTDEAAGVRERLLAKVPQAAPFMDAPIVHLRLTVRSWRATDVVNGWLPGKELANPVLADQPA